MVHSGQTFNGCKILCLLKLSADFIKIMNRLYALNNVNNSQSRAKKVKKKSRECHNHKPQPLSDSPNRALSSYDMA